MLTSFPADEGRVYKVVQWYNDEGVPGSALLDIFDIMPGLPITAMEISKKVRCGQLLLLLISRDIFGDLLVACVVRGGAAAVSTYEFLIGSVFLYPSRRSGVHSFVISENRSPYGVLTPETSTTAVL